jgi:Restriction endonuclease
VDRGRDIVPGMERTDVDGHRYTERWFIDCKHYVRGVPPDALHGTIAWAQSERPDVVLFIASGYFTNGAKDWLEGIRTNSAPAFRLRMWELPQLRRLRADHMDVAFRHDVETETLRRVLEILAAESELFDRLWYGRSPNLDHGPPDGWSRELFESARAAQRRIEEQYGAEVLRKDVEDQWHWGFLSGKISAIRWVLGMEWDFLDS